MRKILSLLLAVVMAVGISAPAVAAGYTDVSAVAQVGPIEKLSALSILTGYADGTFKPENSITRAEMAAVIVRALGLGFQARGITTPPGFADVTSTYDWAYGYITLANARGIIKGDPDGKFRPGDSVTYAEAITMLLRGGCWDQACSLTPWPTGFVAKATELGLTFGVAFDATAFANRGAVAVMTYNALSMPLARWNSSANAYMSDTISFGSFYLEAEEKTVIVTSVPCVNPALKEDQVITVDGTMSVPSDVKTDGLLGQDVTVIRVRGDRYAYVKVSTPSARVLGGTCVSSQASTIVLNDGGADVTKYVATGATYYRGKAMTGWGDLIPGDALTLILDATGKVRFALANYSAAAPVEQPSPTVSGEVTAVSLTARGEGVLVIGGVSYVISPAAFDAHAVTLDSGELQLDQISNLINYNVVLTLNSGGQVTVVKGAATTLIGALTKVDSANSKITVSVAGVSSEYVCICTVPAGLSDSDRINRVVMTQRADGKITRLDYLVLTNGGVVWAIDPVTKTITLGIGRPPTLNSIATYTDETVGIRYWTSGDVSIISVGDQITVWSTVRGGVVKYFETRPMPESSHGYGLFVSQTMIDGKIRVSVDQLGRICEYEVAEASSLAGIVKITRDSFGGVTSIVNVEYEGSPDYTFTINSISGTSYTVTRNDGVIQTHDIRSVRIYRQEGDRIVSGQNTKQEGNRTTIETTIDLKPGMRYMRVATGGLAEVILILATP